MWYSSGADADGHRIRPSRDTSTNCRGIRPLMDRSTYRHRDVGYGQSSQQQHALGVQHRFITPGQRRHIKVKNLDIKDFTKGWHVKYIFEHLHQF